MVTAKRWATPGQRGTNVQQPKVLVESSGLGARHTWVRALALPLAEMRGNLFPYLQKGIK